jgi:hypothetical protein
MRRRTSRPAATPIVSTGPNLACEIHDDDTTVHLRREGDRVTLHTGFGIGAITISRAAAQVLAGQLTAIAQEQTR